METWREIRGRVKIGPSQPGKQKLPVFSPFLLLPPPPPAAGEEKEGRRGSHGSYPSKAILFSSPSSFHCCSIAAAIALPKQKGKLQHCFFPFPCTVGAYIQHCDINRSRKGWMISLLPKAISYKRKTHTHRCKGGRGVGESQNRSSELGDVHPITSLLSTICCLLLPLLLRATTLVGRRRRRGDPLSPAGRARQHDKTSSSSSSSSSSDRPEQPKSRTRQTHSLSLSLFTQHVFPLYIGFFSPRLV